MRIESYELREIERQTKDGVFRREFTSDALDHKHQLRLEKMAEWLKKRGKYPFNNPEELFKTADRTASATTTTTTTTPMPESIPITFAEIYDEKAKRFIAEGVISACETIGDVKDFSNYKMVCCPAHGDNNPSLKVEEVDDNYCLLHCFGGCDFKDLVNSFKEFCGEEYDEHDQPAQHDKRDESCSTGASGEEVYDYTNADGKVLYQVVKRRDVSSGKKICLQRTLKFDGSWVNKLTVNPVLYGLPRVLKAIEEKKPVLIVEGEKDAETVMKYFPEVAVTTNSGGAGNWKNEYSEMLKGAVRLLIIPDNDDAGRKYVEDIATSLKKLGKDLFVVELPGIDEIGIGADVTDWFEADNVETRRKQLKQAVKKAKPYRPPLSKFGIVTGDQLKAMKAKEHEFVVESLCPVGLTNLFATEKVGKSVLAMQMGLAVATGRPLFNRLKVQQGRVLYLALEQGRQINRNRLEMIAPNLEILESFNLVSAEDGWEQADKGGLANLEEYITYYNDSKLIIIDVWQAIAPMAGGNLNAYERDSKHLKPLHELAYRNKVAIVIVHHKNKSYNAVDDFEKVSGSRGMLSVPDHLITMSRPPDDPNGQLMTKSRVGTSVRWALKFNWQDGRLYWEYVGDAVEHKKSKEREDIIDVLQSCPEPLSIRDIVDLLRDEKGVYKNAGSVKRLLSKMFMDGEVDRPGKGIYAVRPGGVFLPSENARER